MRGEFRHLPWREQPHVVQNPRYPHARGFPQVEFVDRPHVFALNDRVRPKHWAMRQIGATSCIVIGTRMSREFKREALRPQVMIADEPGKWWAASHFELESRAS